MALSILGETGKEMLMTETMIGIFTLLCSIGEKPKYIRWYNNKSPNSELAQQVAELAKFELNNTRVNLSTQNEMTLLIVDRSFDLQTVLLEHFHFGTMVMNNAKMSGSTKGRNIEISVEIERGESFGLVKSHIGEEKKLYYLNDENEAWQYLRFQLPPVVGYSFTGLQNGIDLQYSAAAKVQQWLKQGDFNKKKLNEADTKLYKKGIKEFLPYKEKRSSIILMQYMFSVMSNPRDPKTKAERDRREDLTQFQQAVVMGADECFFGGADENLASDRISVENKLINILTEDRYERFQKEQNLIIYYVTKGSAGITRRVKEAMQQCDNQWGANCDGLMKTIDCILGADFRPGPEPDRSREANWVSAKNDPQAKGNFGTVKVKGPPPREVTDYAAMASVSELTWPEVKDDQKNAICEQASIFNRWNPRLYGICDALLTTPGGGLDEDVCPFTHGQERAGLPTGRKGHRRAGSLSGPKWGGGGSAKDEKKDGAAPGLVVFVIGGIVHEEIQAVHELINKHKVDVYLGSTHMTTPSLFMEKGLQRKETNANGTYAGANIF